MKVALRLVVVLSIASAFIMYSRYHRELLVTDLYHAVQQGDAHAVEQLLKRGASPNGRPRSPSPLSLAIGQGNAEVARELIQAKADGVPNGYICKASMSGNAAILQELIRLKADLTRPCEYAHGFTPLMVAAERGSEEVVRMLLQNGADPNARYRGRAEFDGETALTRAIIAGRGPIASVLLKHGADPNIHFNNRK